MTSPPAFLQRWAENSWARGLAVSVSSPSASRLLAWAVTVVVLGLLFVRIPFDETYLALEHASPWTIPAMAGLVFANYLADSFAVWKTTHWFITPIRLSEVLAVRGATYLLAVINYALGQSAYAIYLKRAQGISVPRAIAGTLVIIGISMLSMLLLSTLGLWWSD